MLTPDEWRHCRLAYNEGRTVLVIALPGRLALFTRAMELLQVIEAADIVTPALQLVPQPEEPRHNMTATAEELGL